jgi:hypothetical protein
MEPELNALLPELALFAVARVKLPSSTLTVEDLPAYTRNTLDSLAPCRHTANRRNQRTNHGSG